MAIKNLVKTNADVMCAFVVAIPIVLLGVLLNISDFLQACVTIIPITLVVLSLFVSFNKKFILVALNNKEYAKQLYRAFLTPTISSLLSLITAFFANYNLIIYFIAIFLLFYSLFSLIDLILYLLDTYKKLAHHKKL
jgi:hypothetical protein